MSDEEFEQLIVESKINIDGFLQLLEKYFEINEFLQYDAFFYMINPASIQTYNKYFLFLYFSIFKQLQAIDNANIKFFLLPTWEAINLKLTSKPVSDDKEALVNFLPQIFTILKFKEKIQPNIWGPQINKRRRYFRPRFFECL